MILELLKKHLEGTKQEIKDLGSQVSHLQDQIRAKQIVADQTLQEIQKICIHDKTYKIDEGVAGGYYDRSYITTTLRCFDCGLKLGENTTYGGYQ
jgi:hypothetical protein